MKKLYISLVILLSFSLPGIAKNEPATCDQVLSVCSRYVKELEEQTYNLEARIESQKAKIDELDHQTKTVPWHWYFLGGIIISLVISIVANKMRRKK